MASDTTTGIPNPDKPGHWLVPPWPAGADFHEVVRHFMVHHPWGVTSRTHLRAYYEGFLAALDAAPTQEQPSALVRRWYADMRDCVARCARLYRPEPAAEIRPARRDPAPVRPAA